VICPTCKGYVGERYPGLLFVHLRYADHCGYEADRSHRLVQCEASEQVVACIRGQRCAECEETEHVVALERRLTDSGFRWVDP
jgi:hypothetical protein